VIRKIASAPIIKDFIGFISGGSGGGGGGGGGGFGRAALVGASTPVIINFNGLVTSPVATGREVRRVLTQYDHRVVG
jgi:hypothetical protein